MRVIPTPVPEEMDTFCIKCEEKLAVTFADCFAVIDRTRGAKEHYELSNVFCICPICHSRVVVNDLRWVHKTWREELRKRATEFIDEDGVTKPIARTA